jgi:hypothetical protein
MRSPILHLESSIQGVPFQIAPENLDKFMEYRDRYNISIELSNDKLLNIYRHSVYIAGFYTRNIEKDK